MQVAIQQLRKLFCYENVVKDLNFFVGPTHQKINLASSSVEQKTTSIRLFFGKKCENLSVIFSFAYRLYREYKDPSSSP